jgi:hypothetical protein
MSQGTSDGTKSSLPICSRNYNEEKLEVNEGKEVLQGEKQREGK